MEAIRETAASQGPWRTRRRAMNDDDQQTKRITRDQLDKWSNMSQLYLRAMSKETERGGDVVVVERIRTRTNN